MDRQPLFDAFALRAMTLAFGAWAAVVAWGVNQISNQIEAIHNSQTVTAERFQHHEEEVLQRLAALEEKERSLEAKSNGH